MQIEQEKSENTGAEVILKEHRRWTRWLKGRRSFSEGNLTLTNRRILFLHRIESNPGVSANIKRLSDAPIESVLNYAITLDKNNFQIPLSSVTKVGTGFYLRHLQPFFYLKLSFTGGKKNLAHTAAFQFRRPFIDVISKPQLLEVWKWVSAIKKAIRKQSPAGR